MSELMPWRCNIHGTHGRGVPNCRGCCTPPAELAAELAAFAGAFEGDALAVSGPEAHELAKQAARVAALMIDHAQPIPTVPDHIHTPWECGTTPEVTGCPWSSARAQPRPEDVELIEARRARQLHAERVARSMVPARRRASTGTAGNCDGQV